MTSVERVKKAIDRLYLAFADQPTPSSIEGCPHCIEAKEIGILLSKPLRDITQDELSGYASSAFLTVGDTPDYFYFLPRIIEVTLLDEFVWPDLEITARAIHDSGFDSWPEERRQALISVFEAYLEQIIETKEYRNIDSLLCAVGRMDADVRPFLRMIEQVPEAVLAFWEDNAKDLQNGKLGNPFWDPPTKQYDVIVEWFNSDGISAIYAEAYGYRVG